jgi:ZIP family zinc transporter
MTDNATILLLATLAAASTAVGGLIVLLWRVFPRKMLGLALGFAAGAMIYVSLMELLPASISSVGFGWANLAFFGGIVFFGALDLIVPHDYIAGRCDGRLMSVGVMTAVGIALHNIPEGIALATTAAGDLSLGVSLAVALTIHNIPEGIAVAAPILVASGSRRRAMGYAVLTGLTELLGAVLAIVLLRPLLEPAVMAAGYGFVGGVMVAVSLDELLPSCFENSHSHKSAIGIVIGMAVMAASVWLMG